MEICAYGCGKPAITFFKNGRGCCSKNINACSAKKKRSGDGVSVKRQEMGDAYWSNGHPKGATGLAPWNKDRTGLQTAWNKGLVGDSRITGKASTIEKELERKSKLSKVATKRHADGWDNKAGRCKKYKYSSEIAGDITVDGTWELAVAKWLDEQQFNWRRNKVRFAYTHLKGHQSNYTPDFWVEELGGYLEVKGYETKLDRCKWSQFTENLIVWKKQELKALEIL